MAAQPALQRVSLEFPGFWLSQVPGGGPGIIATQDKFPRAIVHYPVSLCSATLGFFALKRISSGWLYLKPLRSLGYPSTPKGKCG